MEKYYLNEKAINPVWMDQKAQEAAHSFFKPYDQPKLAASQLRKFYNDVKAMERQWRNSGGDEEAFALILPLFKLLKAKSHYALKRKVIPAAFRDWLCEHVDSVNSARDFRAFLLHFEAVVGFSYGYAKGNFN